MGTKCLIVVEPWFTAVGHPAQSLLNTARTLGRRDEILYVASKQLRQSEMEPAIDELHTYGRVARFLVPSTSLALGTMLAIPTIGRLAREKKTELDVFFLDAHLPILALGTPILRKLTKNIRLVSALGLFGPESFLRKPWHRRALAKLLSSRNNRLFFRTEELACSWQAAFAISDKQQIDTLPSLEIPEHAYEACFPLPSGPLRFGIIGQLRIGKGIEWLAPLFKEHPHLGELKIVGSFPNTSIRKELSFLTGYPCLDERYVSDQDLVPLAASFDYLLTLYDPWDGRLEAATFYLGARAGRPVISYGRGWCGRMIREFKCGISVDFSPRPGPEFFRWLPHRNSFEYKYLVEGMNKFRAAHSGELRRNEFLRKLVHGF